MKRRAFTLVELLVTMIILAMLAAFTIPTYQLILSQLQLDSTVSEISDYLRLASQRTVTEQVVYGVTLTDGSTTIPMYTVDGATTTNVQTFVLPTNMQINSVSFGGANDVRFSTAGAPSSSGSFVVKDLVRNRKRTIEIRPSGNIRDNQVEQ